MASQSEHMTVTQPETQVESDQVALAVDDDLVQTESRFAPPFPDPVVPLGEPEVDVAGESETAVASSAVEIQG
jgi:hypothetical protein